MNFAEQYPRCADCPYLVSLQNQYDSMNEAFQEAVVRTSLDQVADEHWLEGQRAEFDQKYAEMLEAVETGMMAEDHPEFVRATKLYRSLDGTVQKANESQAAESEQAQRMINGLNEVLALRAEYLTDDCHGELRLAFLGFRKVICRSPDRFYI